MIRLLSSYTLLPCSPRGGELLSGPGWRVHRDDKGGKEGYWISVAGDAEDGGPGTDFHAVMQGFVSVTPLQLDRTFQDGLSSLQPWLEGLL
jgi:broad specificity polyphosphatase/5'/3'-nucleotidase SurE